MNVIYPCDLVPSFSVDWILVRGSVLVILVDFAEHLMFIGSCTIVIVE